MMDEKEMKEFIKELDNKSEYEVELNLLQGIYGSKGSYKYDAATVWLKDKPRNEARKQTAIAITAAVISAVAACISALSVFITNYSL